MRLREIKKLEQSHLLAEGGLESINIWLQSLRYTFIIFLTVQVITFSNNRKQIGIKFTKLFYIPLFTWFIQRGYYWPSFTDEETDTQKGYITSLKSHSFIGEALFRLE